MEVQTTSRIEESNSSRIDESNYQNVNQNVNRSEYYQNLATLQAKKSEVYYQNLNQK